MLFDSTSVKTIIRAGGSIVINSNDYNSTSLQEIARTAKTKGTKLTIKVNSNISSTDLQTKANPLFLNSSL